MGRFSDDEIRRYGRQMTLPEIGGIGQARLRGADVVAHGEVEALYLAGAGVGHLTVPNEAVAEAVRALNPLVRTSVARAETDPGDVATQALRALATLKEVLGL
jgi:adenylyltransferase/sulfurtransferase